MELIKIIEKDGQRSVSARELHNFLEVQTQFHIWIKRMFEYGFTENQDFVLNIFEQHLPQGGGHNKTDYALTIDTAKEIAMLQRTDKGKQARTYFIEIEKKYKTQPLSHLEITQTAINSLVEHDKRLQLLETQIKIFETETKPKIEYYDKVLNSESLMTINTIALNLGISSIALNKFLVDAKITYKQGGKYFLYSEYRGKGYADYVTHDYVDSKGIQRSAEQLKWSQKGRSFIIDLYKKNNAIESKPVIENEIKQSVSIMEEVNSWDLPELLLECKHCKKSFKRTHRYRLYCSVECKKAYHKAKQTEKLNKIETDKSVKKTPEITSTEYTIKEFAAIFGITEQTIRNYIANGLVCARKFKPYPDKDYYHYRVNESEISKVEKFINERINGK